MPEWRPGVLEALLADINVVGQAGLRAGLYKIAASVEAKAKAKLSETSHQYGTPSPAPQGGPPALVSGAGRRSIGHQYIREGIETVMRVGTMAGVYGPRSNTPSSKYLNYQETLGQFDHPFLKPAFLEVIQTEGVAVWLAAFRVWPRI